MDLGQDSHELYKRHGSKQELLVCKKVATYIDNLISCLLTSCHWSAVENTAICVHSLVAPICGSEAQGIRCNPEQPHFCCCCISWKIALTGWVGNTLSLSYSCMDVVGALNRKCAPRKTIGKRRVCVCVYIYTHTHTYLLKEVLVESHLCK